VPVLCFWFGFALRCVALLCSVCVRLHLVLFPAGGPVLPSFSVKLQVSPDLAFRERCCADRAHCTLLLHAVPVNHQNPFVKDYVCVSTPYSASGAQTCTVYTVRCVIDCAEFRGRRARTPKAWVRQSQAFRTDESKQRLILVQLTV
jgi:hypothetical protein